MAAAFIAPAMLIAGFTLVHGSVGNGLFSTALTLPVMLPAVFVFRRGSVDY